MTQTPPTGPTPTGGQPMPGFPPPAYQPPNAAPPAQPPAAPPTYQPPPGGGFPPGAYPQQPGYPPQPGYPQAPGYPPAPTGKASSSKVLIIVIAAVVALALIGGGLMLMAKTPQPTPPVTPTQPTDPNPPTQPPQPTEQPTQPNGPTEQPQPPNGDVIDLTHGVKFQVAAGFQIEKQSQNMVKVTDGKSALISVVDQVDPKTNPVQLCDSYNRSILKEVSGAQFAKAEKIDVNASNLAGAKCLAVFVDASGGSSTQTYVQSFIAVRDGDGVVTAQTVLFTEATPESSFTGINEMLSVVLTSQSKG
jgi:hypothetical protein